MNQSSYPLSTYPSRFTSMSTLLIFKYPLSIIYSLPMYITIPIPHSRTLHTIHITHLSHCISRIYSTNPSPTHFLFHPPCLLSLTTTPISYLHAWNHAHVPFTLPITIPHAFPLLSYSFLSPYPSPCKPNHHSYSHFPSTFLHPSPYIPASSTPLTHSYLPSLTPYTPPTISWFRSPFSCKQSPMSYQFS